jgi:hypothetical protein
MIDVVGGDVLSALKPAHYVIQLVGFEVVVVIEAGGSARVEFCIETIRVLGVSQEL